MYLLPDSWNELLDWLYGTTRESMSSEMWAARQVTLFHGEVCNGGLYDKLAYRQDEYPHEELLSSYQVVCGEELTSLLRQGLSLLEQPWPHADLSREGSLVLHVASDSVLRGHDLATTVATIGMFYPECPMALRELVYGVATAQALYMKPWDALDQRYYSVGEQPLVQVAEYSQRFHGEWRPSCKK